MAPTLVVDGLASTRPALGPRAVDGAWLMKLDLLGVTASEPPPMLPSPLPRAQRLDGAAILLVDADVGYVDAMTLLLRMEGARLRAASSAEDAARMLARWQPDVLLGDPEIIDARVHAALSSAVLRVAATAEPSTRSRASLLRHYDAIVPKPLDVDALVERIARHLWTDFGDVDLSE